MTLNFIREVPDSNLCRGASYPEKIVMDLLSPTNRLQIRYLQIGHDRLLSTLLRFTVYDHLIPLVTTKPYSTY